MTTRRPRAPSTSVDGRQTARWSGRPRSHGPRHGFFDTPGPGAWSPDGSLLAASTAHCTIVLLDGGTGAVLGHLVGHANLIGGLAWSPDGALIASAARDNTVQIWDARALADPQSPRIVLEGGDTDGVAACAFAGDGQTLLSTGRDGELRIWRLPRWDQVANLDLDRQVGGRLSQRGPGASAGVRSGGRPGRVGGSLSISSAWTLAAGHGRSSPARRAT